MSDHRRAIALVLASSALGSTGAALGKLAVPETGVATLVAAQYLVCALLLLPQSGRTLTVHLPGRIWAWHAVRGLGGLLCFLFFYLALQHIPLADSVLLRNAAPLWVPLLGLALGITLDRRALAPVLLGLAGIVLLMQPGQAGISFWHLVGGLSGLAFALVMHGTRLLATHEPARRILLMYFLTALAFALPWAIWAWRPFPLTRLPALLGVGLCLFGSLSLFTRAYALLPTQQLAPFAYTSVLFAGLLDWLIWQHTPNATALAGMALVIASGILLARRPVASPIPR